MTTHRTHAIETSFLLALCLALLACGESEDPADAEEGGEKVKAVVEAAPVEEDEEEELSVSSLMREGAGKPCPSFFDGERVGCAMAAFGTEGKAEGLPDGEHWFLGLVYTFDARSNIKADEPLQRPEVSVLLWAKESGRVGWSVGRVTAQTSAEDAFLLDAGPKLSKVIAGQLEPFVLPAKWSDLFRDTLPQAVIESEAGESGFIVGDGLGELRRVESGWIVGTMGYSSNDDLEGFQVHVFTDGISSLAP